MGDQTGAPPIYTNLKDKQIGERITIFGKVKGVQDYGANWALGALSFKILLTNGSDEAFAMVELEDNLKDKLYREGIDIKVGEFVEARCKIEVESSKEQVA